MDTADIACAKLVQATDPRRFRATMAAPVSARPALFAVYAANLEFARAAWASDEPLIAQMRLQFWHDTLDALQTGTEPPYPHDILPALQRLPKPALALLQMALTARNEDLDRHGWPDWDCAGSYAQRTAGAVMQAATAALGGDPDSIHSDLLQAHSLITFLEACPDLTARGLATPNPAEAAAHVPKLREMRFYMKQTAKAARPALLESWLRPMQTAALHTNRTMHPNHTAASLRLIWASLWL